MALRRLALVAAPLLAVTLVAAALPFWFGLEAEKTVQRLVERGNARGWIVTVENYDRGWLSSTADARVAVAGLPLEAAARHRISHGPFPVDRILGGDLDFAPVQARISSELTFTTKDASAPPFAALKAETTIGITGEAETRLEVPARRLAGRDGAAVDWRGMTGTLGFDPELKRVAFDLRSPGLILNNPAGRGPQGQWRVGTISLQGQAEQGVGGYYFGTNRFSAEYLELGPDLVFRGLELQSTAKPAADNVNLAFAGRLKQVEVAGKRYGPATIAIEARRLDAATLGRFESELSTVYRRRLPPEQTALIVLGKTMEIVGQLSKKAPEVELTRLSLVMPAGEVTGTAKLVLDGSRLNITQNPMLILTALKADLEVVLPRATVRPLIAPLVRRDIEDYSRRGALTRVEAQAITPEMFDRIVDEALPQYLPKHELTRYLVADGERLLVKATLRQGRFLVNDEPWRGPLVRLP